MKTPLVSLRQVSVRYDGTCALEGVDLDIYPDDFIGIIGLSLIHISEPTRH